MAAKQLSLYIVQRLCKWCCICEYHNLMQEFRINTPSVCINRVSIVVTLNYYSYKLFYILTFLFFTEVK